jgi:glutamine phosphoribosylpyrophosphate amidotransferase
VRYSTTGSSVLCNAQPIMAETPFGMVAVAHNGNLLNAASLRAEMLERGVYFEGTNDSEVIARLIAEYHTGNLEDAVVQAAKRLQGGYALVVLSLASGARHKEAKEGSIYDLDLEPGDEHYHVAHPKGEDTYGEERDQP